MRQLLGWPGSPGLIGSMELPNPGNPGNLGNPGDLGNRGDLGESYRCFSMSSSSTALGGRVRSSGSMASGSSTRFSSEQKSRFDAST